MSPASIETPASILDLTRPGMIEASAGTGKTYTIAEIYLALLCGKKHYSSTQSVLSHDTLSETPPPSVREILVVTFTEAATAELSDRLKKRIRQALELRTLALPEIKNPPPLTAREHILLRLADAEFDEAAISTIHGFCTRMLRDFSVDCGLPPSLVPAENIANEREHFAARFRTRQRLLGNEKINDIPTGDIAQILGLLSKNPDISVAPPSNPEDPRLFVAREGLEAWLQERKNSDTLSFDEILLCLRDALRKSDALAEKISRRYKIALVDEFQDTDPVQWEIFDRIFVSKARPFFCVGDPKQAIYEFRGGDILTYRHAQNKITKHKNKLELNKNWRSTPEMVAAFNEIFEADSAIPKQALKSKSKQVALSTTIGGNLDYKTAIAAKSSPKKCDESPAPQAAIFLREGFAGNGETARAAITKKIAEDIDVLVNKRKIRPSACAVLVKTNREAPEILNALTKRGIPAVMTATASVLEEPEAEDLEKILSALITPRDANAVRHAANSRFFGNAFFSSFFSDNENNTLAQLQESFFEASKIWEQKGILPAFSYLEKRHNLSQSPACGLNSSRSLTNFRHLLELLQTSAHKGNLPPRALLKKFCEMREHPNADSEEQRLRIDSDAPAVQITTVHKSKGLQYDIVFLPSLWNLPFEKSGKQAPTSARRKNKNGDSEIIFNDKSSDFQKAEIESSAQTNACVTYVAFTRAKQACVVYHAHATSRNVPVNSYARQLFETAGILGKEEQRVSLPHWKILHENAPLPEIPYTLEKEENKPSTRVLNSPPKHAMLAENPWGIFSFSKIIGSHSDTLPENFEPETPVSERSREDTSEALVYPAPEQYDLPAGAQFGTLVHSIFEKLNFQNCKNLESLIAQNRSRFPAWLDAEDSQKKFRKLFESTLQLPFDGELTLSQINVARDALRELEFFFNMKRTDNLYAKLHDVFSSWGGIYKRTAEALWNDPAQNTCKIDGLMHGYIDLVARSNNRYYVIDWKTNRVMAKGEKSMTRQNLEDEIVESGYALQWSIYTLALRKYLQKTLGLKYNTSKNLGGIAYFFVRWDAVFFDNSLDDAKLDSLESVLMEKEI